MMQTIKHLVKGEDIGTQIYDRKNKQVINERRPVKEHLEAELMYQKPIDKLDEDGIVRHELLTESIHMGHEKNQEKSAKGIPDFIKFYDIDMTQFQKEKPEDFRTFNDFFIREVKSEKRPIASPNDPNIVTSAADCRLIVFNSLEETKDLWIKGKKFSFEKLLNHDQALTEHFRYGSVANFRLAPQDYHRFHSPVAGTIERITNVGGTLYSVKPKAINSEIDVLGENERDIIVIDGANGIGKVAFVAIGAERVGRVTTLRKEGATLQKGDELGYFSYGGSDVLCIFEKKVKWDQDLMEKSLNGMETMLHVNERIGTFDLNEQADI